MALRRLPNFSRRADKHCTCGLNVAHTQVSNHRMRLRVVMRLRVEAFYAALRCKLFKLNRLNVLGAGPSRKIMSKSFILINGLEGN